jgi:hypothetical protein
LGEVVELGDGLLGVILRDDDSEGAGDVFAGNDFVELAPDE